MQAQQRRRQATAAYSPGLRLALLLLSMSLPERAAAFLGAPALATRAGQFGLAARASKRACAERHTDEGRESTELGPTSHPSRRAALEHLGVLAVGLGLLPSAAHADSCTRKDCQPQANFLPAGDAPKQKDMVQMPGLKGKNYGKSTTNYPDYTKEESGLQYKDAKTGTGANPQQGDRVVFDWEGYTIGYYGRIFKAKNGVKGGAFDAETEFERFVVGGGTIVPGLEEGILGMKVGGVRQIVVPAEIGYPLNDPPHEKVGPKPPNFDGQRALNFVLYNQGLIDKTLLFNVKVIRIDTPNGKGGFTRGVVQASGGKTPAAKKAQQAEEDEQDDE